MKMFMKFDAEKIFFDKQKVFNLAIFCDDCT